MLETRMRETLSQLAIVGEKKQSLAVQIEAPHRVKSFRN